MKKTLNLGNFSNIGSIGIVCTGKVLWFDCLYETQRDKWISMIETGIKAQENICFPIINFKKFPDYFKVLDNLV